LKAFLPGTVHDILSKVSMYRNSLYYLVYSLRKAT